MFLARTIRSQSVPFSSKTKPLSLVLFAASRSLFTSRIYYPSIRRWSALENGPPPVTALISSALPRWDLSYFSFDGITGFMRPSLATLIGIVLRVPTMGERGFVFLKKRRGKKFSRIIFSTPANSSPVSHVTRCINIYSGWIARTNAA